MIGLYSPQIWRSSVCPTLRTEAVKVALPHPKKLLEKLVASSITLAIDCRILLKFGVWMQYLFTKAVIWLKSTCVHHTR